MAIPILFELNQELTRLFVAGSRLSNGDPRIKKFIEPLKKYGEKSPVFLKLAQYMEGLLSVEAGQSAQKLIETEVFLLSVLSTQGDTSPNPDYILKEISHAQNDERLAEINTGYRTLAPVIDALTTTGGGRLEIIKQAFDDGVFKDPRLYKISVDALGDKYSEIAEYMENKVLPSMGEGIFPFLIDGYNIKGGNIDGRRLSVMHKLKGERIFDLVDETIENGNATVKAEAVKIMANYPKYEEVLLGMLGESKSVRDEVMKALVKMDSKTGIDKLTEIYKGDKAGTVLDALSYGESEYLADKLLKTAYADYEAVKKSDVTVKEIEKLKDDIKALGNKHLDSVAQFLKTMLSEEYLVKAEATLPKDKKQGYYYRSLEESALETLYHSNKGNDFIWDMFTEMQEGFLNKIIKPKNPKNKNISSMLYSYAFSIGAKKLDPDKFYNTFFKTNLYKDIAKYDYYAFQNAFLQDQSCPPFSKKIARYFVENMNDYNHMSLAVRIVAPDDYETIDFLAEHLKNNLTKNSYSYVNYSILKLLGETKNKNFKKLYELYCSKNHGSASEKEYLEQFLTE